MFPGAMMTVGCQNAVLCFFLLRASGLASLNHQLPIFPSFFLNSPGARWFQGKKIRTDHLRAYHRGKGGTRRCALLGFGGFARLSQVAKREGAMGCCEALEMLTCQDSTL